MGRSQVRYFNRLAPEEMYGYMFGQPSGTILFSSNGDINMRTDSKFWVDQEGVFRTTLSLSVDCSIYRSTLLIPVR